MGGVSGSGKSFQEVDLSVDYEDAMQIASAVAGRVDYLVTRDKEGFPKSPVKILSPRELCKEFRGENAAVFRRRAGLRNFHRLDHFLGEAHDDLVFRAVAGSS